MRKTKCSKKECSAIANYRNRYTGEFLCDLHVLPIGCDTIEDYEKITGDVVE